MKIRHYVVAFQIIAILLVSGVSFSQDYPRETIRLIVPYAPGGSASLLARIFSEKLSLAIGQPVVQDFRPGAAGGIAADIARKSKPDGYTLIIGSNGPMAINPSLYKKLSYDPIKDFDPVSLLCTMPGILIVNNAVPAKSVKELIVHAKSNPGKLTFGSSGNGSTLHLGGELFNSMAGVKMKHIPYKGAGPAMIDLLGERISMMFCNISSGISQVKAGKVRILGVMSKKRAQILPDVPTIAESGLSGYEMDTWYGLYVPKGTPKEIIAKLNSETAKITKMSDFKDPLFASGIEAASSSPEELTAFMESEIAKYAKIVKESGATIN